MVFFLFRLSKYILDYEEDFPKAYCCLRLIEILIYILIASFSELFDYFEYVAGSDTFNFNKPDPRHLTDVVEIIGGDLKKTIMIGDSEVDEMAAVNAKLPFVSVADGYTEKSADQIKHDFYIKDYIGFEKIISKYL